MVAFTPNEPLGVALLAGWFFCSVVGSVFLVRPILERWSAGQRFGGAVGSAVVATGLVLALLQVLPEPETTKDKPGAGRSESTANARTPSVRTETAGRLDRPFDREGNLLAPYTVGSGPVRGVLRNILRRSGDNH
jgi:hypothetical protein